MAAITARSASPEALVARVPASTAGWFAAKPTVPRRGRVSSQTMFAPSARLPIMADPAWVGRIARPMDCQACFLLNHEALTALDLRVVRQAFVLVIRRHGGRQWPGAGCAITDLAEDGAILVWSAWRMSPMARLRSVAIRREREPVRTGEESLRNATSRTQWTSLSGPLAADVATNSDQRGRDANSPSTRHT